MLGVYDCSIIKENCSSIMKSPILVIILAWLLLVGGIIEVGRGLLMIVLGNSLSGIIAFVNGTVFIAVSFGIRKLKSWAFYVYLILAVPLIIFQVYSGSWVSLIFEITILIYLWSVYKKSQLVSKQNIIKFLAVGVVVGVVSFFVSYNVGDVNVQIPNVNRGIPFLTKSLQEGGIGGAPHDLAISGNTLFVADTGLFTSVTYKRQTHAAVYKVDLQSYKLVDVITVPESKIGEKDGSPNFPLLNQVVNANKGEAEFGEYSTGMWSSSLAGFYYDYPWLNSLLEENDIHAKNSTNPEYIVLDEKGNAYITALQKLNGPPGSRPVLIVVNVKDQSLGGVFELPNSSILGNIDYIDVFFDYSSERIYMFSTSEEKNVVVFDTNSQEIRILPVKREKGSGFLAKNDVFFLTFLSCLQFCPLPRFEIFDANSGVRIKTIVLQ